MGSATTKSKSGVKTASKLSAVKALAKSLMGNRKDGKKKAATAPAKPAAKVAASKAPAKAAARSSGKVPATAAKASAPMKTAAPTKKSAPMKTTAPKAAPAKAAPAKAAAPAPAQGKKGAAPAKPAVPAKASAATPAPAKAAKGAAGLTGKAASAPAGKVGKGSRVSRSGLSRLSAEEVCREVACEGLSTTAGYCRLHYIKNWKKIKRKELILKEGKLNQYIEELVAKYPDKYIDAIRQDLESDKDFAKVIYDLDLDESVDDFDVEGENAEALIDTIKRDFDDEGEGGF